jgi:hypothetical protein
MNRYFFWGEVIESVQHDFQALPPLRPLHSGVSCERVARARPKARFRVIFKLQLNCQRFVCHMYMRLIVLVISNVSYSTRSSLRRARWTALERAVLFDLAYRCAAIRAPKAWDGYEMATSVAPRYAESCVDRVLASQTSRAAARS